MTTQARGRYRAPRTIPAATWLLAAVGAVVLFVVLALAATAAFAAPGVRAEYGGSRWQHANRAVCITTKNIRTTAVKDAVKRSAYYWSANTMLDVRVRYDCAALGYTQRIEVFDRHYDRKNSGWIERPGGVSWVQVPTAGSWTVGGWTYVHRSPVYVKINRTYTDGSSSWRQHTVSHEIGHALGLGHNSECAVMTSNTGCTVYKYGGWWDWTGSPSNPGVNRIYADG